MPVTAKLSRKFYDTFGDEIATELVEWFNLVDATYRGDLRELNELNFARFDAKVEQRWAQFETKFAQLDAKIDRRVTELDAKIDRLATQLDAKIDRRIAEVIAHVDGSLAQLETRLTQRMFAFWIAQAATTAGLVLGVVRLLGH